MTNTEEKLVSINAALAERAERLTDAEDFLDVCDSDNVLCIAEVRSLKAQIRDLETEKHALLQELPL